MKSTKEKVLLLLLLAQSATKQGITVLTVNEQRVPCFDGWIPQWALSSIPICGTTEGKRRFRDLRAEATLNEKYIFEIKNVGKKYYYRIRERNGQLKMHFEDNSSCVNS